MKKRNIIHIFLFIIIICLILINSDKIIESIRFSFNLCLKDLFPALIPFMLLSNILINYNFINEISTTLKFLTKKFKICENCSFILIMSLLSGTPSNAKYIKDMLNNKLINIKDAENCLNFCNFTNPIFILNTIGLTFLNNKKLGLIILISNYCSAFIVGLFNKNNFYNKEKYIKQIEKQKFINILTISINNIIDTLLLILGIITAFIIVTTIIDSTFKIPNNLKFLYGIIEIMQGLKYLSLTNFNYKIKAIISSMIISFGGLCIHAQVYSIIDNKKIRYLPYLKSRIIHSLLSGIITYLLIIIFAYNHDYKYILSLFQSL